MRTRYRLFWTLTRQIAIGVTLLATGLSQRSGEVLVQKCQPGVRLTTLTVLTVVTALATLAVLAVFTVLTVVAILTALTMLAVLALLLPVIVRWIWLVLAGKRSRFDCRLQVKMEPVFGVL